MSSVGSDEGISVRADTRPSEIIKMGYLKKLKTMKRKFFVLRASAVHCPACLDYYDSGKKYKHGHPPKRSIKLRSCFSITRRTDTKHKYVVALITRSEWFSVVFDTEAEMQEWLKAMVELRQNDPGRYPVSPNFEHVWRVTIQKKEMGSWQRFAGEFLLCLNEISLTLVKYPVSESVQMRTFEIMLQSIRRCGNLDDFFYIELGQASCIGAGSLWMQVEDPVVARDMHSAIMKACTNCPKKELGPKSRSRSSSANESSKPAATFGGKKWLSTDEGTYGKSQGQQKQTFSNSPPNISNDIPPYFPARRASTGTRPLIPSVGNGSVHTTIGTATALNGRTPSATHYAGGRERCDSLPSTRRKAPSCYQEPYVHNRSVFQPMSGFMSLLRPGTVHARNITFSPSNGSPILTSPSSGCISTDSADSTWSVDVVDNGEPHWSEHENYTRYGYPLTPEEPVILEENNEEYMQWGGPVGVTPDEGRDVKNSTLKDEYMVFHAKNDSHIMGSSLSSQGSSCSPPSNFSPINSASSGHTQRQSPGAANKANTSTRQSQRMGDKNQGNLLSGYMTMAPRNVEITQFSKTQNSVDFTSDEQLSTAAVNPLKFQLEKVTSYLSPSDENSVLNMRTVRAYSAGSKPAKTAKDDIRVRALSVGSQSASYGKVKSSSNGGSPKSTSVSSMDTDDMMEMDFTRNKKRNIPAHQQPSPLTISSLGYMPMDLARRKSDNSVTPLTNQQCLATSSGSSHLSSPHPQLPETVAEKPVSGDSCVCICKCGKGEQKQAVSSWCTNTATSAVGVNDGYVTMKPLSAKKVSEERVVRLLKEKQQQVPDEGQSEYIEFSPGVTALNENYGIVAASSSFSSSSSSSSEPIIIEKGRKLNHSKTSRFLTNPFSSLGRKGKKSNASENKPETTSNVVPALTSSNSENNLKKYYQALLPKNSREALKRGPVVDENDEYALLNFGTSDASKLKRKMSYPPTANATAANVANKGANKNKNVPLNVNSAKRGTNMSKCNSYPRELSHYYRNSSSNVGGIEQPLSRLHLEAASSTAAPLASNDDAALSPTECEEIYYDMSKYKEGENANSSYSPMDIDVDVKSSRNTNRCNSQQNVAYAMLDLPPIDQDENQQNARTCDHQSTGPSTSNQYAEIVFENTSSSNGQT